MTIERKKRILLIAPSPDGKGGISSMVNALYHAEELRNDFKFSWLVSQDDRNKLLNLLTFAAAWLLAPWKILRADLVHIHTASYNSFFRKSFFMRWCVLLGKKYIVHIHGGGFSEFIRKTAERQRAKRLLLLRKATGIITLSDIFRNTLCEYLPHEPPEKFLILPNPGRFDLQPPHRFPEKATILYCGWLEPEKGVFDLLNAFARCKKPDWQLIMAGKGQHEPLLLAAENANIAEQIELRHWQSAEEITKLYTNSTLLVLPSYTEGMPMVILEAMAFGLPVISTQVGAIKEMLPEDARQFLHQPGDVKVLSEHIAELCNNAQLCCDLSKKMQKHFAENYNSCIVLRKQRDIYHNLINFATLKGTNK